MKVDLDLLGCPSQKQKRFKRASSPSMTLWVQVPWAKKRPWSLKALLESQVFELLERAVAGGEVAAAVYLAEHLEVRHLVLRTFLRPVDGDVNEFP